MAGGEKIRFMTEAGGSLVAAYLIRAIQEAGHTAVASDIHATHAGACLADDFAAVPRKDDPQLWPLLERLLEEKRIEAVIPSLDETLFGWAERIEFFRSRGVRIILSPPETVAICQDKWETYRFFTACGIPCPRTSLKQEHPLVKPRLGRGSEGVRITNQPVDMKDMISQEVATGQEYTVDVFFDRNGTPAYIVPRRRLGVQGGKSTGGVVCRHEGIEKCIRRMAAETTFLGPVNFQCFVNGEELSFIEINPRIAGGMALGFAATENWIRLIVSNLIKGRPIEPRPVKEGLKMVRYYAECFLP